MVAPTLTWKQVLAFGPCNFAPIRKLLKAAYPDIDTRAFTLADAAAAGVHFDRLIWIANRASEVDLDCGRRLRLFGADCAARVAHIANDPRSTAAIVASRQFARGEIGAEQLAAARGAAKVAARVAAWDAWGAALAARAAAWAATWAARAAAGEAAKAAAGEAHSDAARVAAWNAEKKWQTERLIAWFSADEPTDWPMSTAVADAA